MRDVDRLHDMSEASCHQDAVEELLFAYRHPLTMRLFNPMAQRALREVIRHGPQATHDAGDRFLMAADFLRHEAIVEGIGLMEVASWAQPQSDTLRRLLWQRRHPLPLLRGGPPALVYHRRGYA